MDELAKTLSKKKDIHQLASHRLSPIHTLNDESIILSKKFNVPDLHPVRASFESSMVSDPRRDAHNFRLKLMKNGN
jgi:hypothetical protein